MLSCLPFVNFAMWVWYNPYHLSFITDQWIVLWTSLPEWIHLKWLLVAVLEELMMRMGVEKKGQHFREPAVLMKYQARHQLLSVPFWVSASELMAYLFHKNSARIRRKLTKTWHMSYVILVTACPMIHPSIIWYLRCKFQKTLPLIPFFRLQHRYLVMAKWTGVE